uniref:AAA family ATPase n=1 Tax=Desulfatirhabdium butyrativorans TaxID=340467 RepID=A0A7C4MPV0_9BACT
MKFPYGICDFNKIITQGYFYCDRTGCIPMLEKLGEYQLFIRPRRFGKSLLLSMLFNYYDVTKASEFETLFGHLEIGKHPTALHNRYFVLRWDFSCVDPFGDVEDIRRSLHDHINACVHSFGMYYQDKLKGDIRIDPKNAISSIQSLMDVAAKSGRKVYLLIDEYDNFANQVLMGVAHDNRKRYEALVFEEGPLRTLFKAIKASTSESLFDRIFITGVSPVVMSDITSGYNIAKNIYHHPKTNDLCGFRSDEVVTAVHAVADVCGLSDAQRRDAVDMMHTWYNGYQFSPDAADTVYNPTLALYFLDTLLDSCKFPSDMLDDNLAADGAKLDYIAQIPGGGQMLLDLVHENARVTVSSLAKRFGIRDLLNPSGKDMAFMASLLYYFGVLTISDMTEEGELVLKVPNLVMRKLYVERLSELLLPNPQERDEGILAAKEVYQKGNIGPLCAFVEEKYFKVFHTPDYRWANELTVKTAFLTLLYNDILYIMDSEPEIDRSRVDLTMIIRPDMRLYRILDVLIEFKFVGLSDAGLSGKEAKALSVEALQALPAMQRAMAEAEAQARAYGRILNDRYGNLRLRAFAVVSLGFERIWAKAVEPS